MFRGGWIVFRIIGALLLIGLMVAGGVALYHAGQAQGYAMGLAAAGQEQVVPAPQNGLAPYYSYAPGLRWGRPFFFPFGPLLGFFVVGGLFFLIFGGLGAIFRRRAWAHGYGGYGPWSGGPRSGSPWGPPPWAGQPQPPAAGEPAQAPQPAPGEPPK